MPGAVSSPYSTFFLIPSRALGPLLPRTAGSGSAARSSAFQAVCVPGCPLQLLKGLPPFTVSTALGKGKGSQTFQITSSCRKLFGTGIKMAAVPTEDYYINLVEMIFIDDMLYFKGEDDGKV